MTLEIGLLSLESLLLLFTIVLLIYSIKEGKQRDKLIMEVGKATRVLTRQEYFLTIIDSMMDAKEEIVGCITGRPPMGDDIRMTRTIMENIKQITQKGIRITYILPKFPDRLHIGHKYMKAGANIMYSSCLMVHNIRFIIVDERVVVMGVPEITGEKESTKKGYRIPSDGLAMVLKNYFNTCEKQSTFTEYLTEVMKQTGTTPEHIAREYNIDEKELRKVFGQ
ncbi:MAG: hypothetical protein AMK71_00190 [Nitrospira bacterium SG8_35_4]|nr:MAG: hypothetical protein AMK71_00190 [Nitrospira bacterium SG8_35_4]